jgi:photosystem II stability/assembly factor-like uncharacterized protein
MESGRITLITTQSVNKESFNKESFMRRFSRSFYGVLILFVCFLAPWASHASAQYAGPPFPSSNPSITWLTPSPHGESINAASFVNAQEGWAVGSFQGAWHTADAGKTWTVNRFGPPLGFHGVYFVDSQYGWAVGQGSDAWNVDEFTSIIWNTTDGGKTWNSQFYLNEQSTQRKIGGFASVYFSDRNNGWAAGRACKLYHTTNGGLTWSKIKNLPLDEQTKPLADFVAMQFVNAQVGFILASHINVKPEASLQKILVTTDGGATWTLKDLPEYNELNPNALFALSFVDDKTGMVAGSGGYVYATADGGDSWVERKAPTQDNVEIQCIVLNSAENAWASTSIGEVLHTTDGGQNWQFIETPKEIFLNSLLLTGGAPFLALGDIGYNVASTDGGQSWTTLAEGGLWARMWSIAFRSADSGWVVGDQGAAYFTADGGASWTKKDLSSTDTLLLVRFVSTDEGWILGKGSLFHTLDGGGNWSPVSLPTTEELTNFFFLNTSTGWVVGRNGVILKTGDGGQSWSIQSSGTDGSINDVHFINEQEGWAALTETDGSNHQGFVLRSADGGKTWEKLPFFAEYKEAALVDIHFFSATEGFANGTASQGEGGMEGIFKTTDGGVSWKFFPPYPFPTKVLYTVHFIGGRKMLITGDLGMLYRSGDGGENWQILPRPTSSDAIADVSFIDSNTGWLLTSMGAVLKMETADAGDANRIVVPHVVQDERYQTVLEIANISDTFHNLYVVGLDRAGKPLRNPEKNNLVQTGKAIWLDPASTSVVALDDLYPEEYLSSIGVLMIYTGEDVDMNKIVSLSVKYQPRQGGEENHYAIRQAAPCQRLFLDRLVAYDPVIASTWSTYAVLANAGAEPVDVWFKVHSPLGDLYAGIIEQLQPLAQSIVVLDAAHLARMFPGVDPATLTGGEFLSYAAGSRLNTTVEGDPVNGLTGVELLAELNDTNYLELLGWMMRGARKDAGAGDDPTTVSTFHFPVDTTQSIRETHGYVPVVDGIWGRFGYYNAGSVQQVISLRHYGPYGEVLGATNVSVNAGTGSELDLADLGFDVSAGGSIKATVLDVEAAAPGSAYWMNGDNADVAATPSIVTGTLAPEMATAAKRLMTVGTGGTFADTLITVINPNGEATDYRIMLRNEKGEFAGIVKGSVAGFGTVNHSLPKYSTDFTGRVEIMADLPVIGLASDYQLDTTSSHLNVSSLPISPVAE